MRISLKQIKCVMLTVEKYQRRCHDVIQTLQDKLNIDMFYGVDMLRPYGCAYSTIKLYSQIVPPILTLEDDVQLTEHFVDTFDVPDDADIVYLGTSSWGGLNGVSQWKNLDLVPYNDMFFKINGMPSAHAVLHLSDKHLNYYREHTFKNYSADCDRGVDYYIAQEQHRFNTYACRKPMFYQHDGNNAFTTLYSLDQVYKDKYGE